jgi:outer membrane protein assembly factor BamB
VAAAAAAVLISCSSPASAPQVTGTSLGSPTSSASTTSGATTPSTAPGAPASWLTYHKDLARSGVDAGGGSAKISAQWSSEALDGDVYAEPLISGERVLVATEGGSVYSLDATSGRVAWRTHVGDPIDGSTLPCGDIDPLGITSTPVIDPVTGLVYVVAFVQPGTHELFALDLASGSVRFHRPVDAPGASPRTHLQRSALSLSHGRVYIPFGGLFGDCGDYHGQVVAVSADGSGDLLAYQVPSQREGGIWAPSGAAVDDAGDLFVSTGNSSSESAFDEGNAVIKLSADLRQLDSFAPTNWQQLNRSDADLGSVGPAIVGGGLLFQIGKTGVGFLLRADHLGGIGGEEFSSQVCRSVYGGTAYSPPFVYVPCTDGVRALRLSNDGKFTVAWSGPQVLAGPPIVARGAVWTLDRAGDLFGLDPENGNVVLQQHVGEKVAHFATPAAGGGRVFLAVDRKVVALG